MCKNGALFYVPIRFGVHAGDFYMYSLCKGGGAVIYFTRRIESIYFPFPKEGIYFLSQSGEDSIYFQSAYISKTRQKDIAYIFNASERHSIYFQRVRKT